MSQSIYVKSLNLGSDENLRTLKIVNNLPADERCREDFRQRCENHIKMTTKYEIRISDVKLCEYEFWEEKKTETMRYPT